MTKDQGKWAAAEAKARFSELIDRALSDGPQTITRKGRETVVVVSAEEWRRKTKRKGNLAEFFAASPLPGSDIGIKRTKDRPRLAWVPETSATFSRSVSPHLTQKRS